MLGCVLINQLFGACICLIIGKLPTVSITLSDYAITQTKYENNDGNTTVQDI